MCNQDNQECREMSETNRFGRCGCRDCGRTRTKERMEKVVALIFADFLIPNSYLSCDQ